MAGVHILGLSVSGVGSINASSACADDRLMASRSATNQPLSHVVGVLLVKVGLVHLEAGQVQCLGKRQVALLPGLVCCRADARNPILQLS